MADTIEPVSDPMPPSTTMTTMNVEFRILPLVNANDEVDSVAFAHAYSAPAIPAKNAEYAKVNIL
ncbi:hypothetical protein SDC9_209951 [bioreactor metagenome]|uniref:Uncharacterized protein n=1 Tax=bioreactor metagenome TaxID=1076179 RepID=A0A645JPJ4_9ZZZZ